MIVGRQVKRLSELPRTPLKPAAVTFELREKLPDDQGGYHVWRARPDIWLDSLDLHLLSMGRQQGQATRHFGDMIDPAPTDPPAEEGPVLETRSPEDLRGLWVRVRMIPSADQLEDPVGDLVTPVIAWMGLIVRKIDEPANVSEGQDPRGVQQWLCVGPERILETIHISTTWWDPGGDDEPVELGRMDGFNHRSDAGTISGNRSNDTRTIDETEVYHFGGRRTWSHLEILEHLIKRYVQQYMDGQAEFPLWTIGGDDAVGLALDVLVTAIAMKPVTKARDLINSTIPAEYGFDAAILPTEEGFEIRLVSLFDQPVKRGDFVMPANTQIFVIDLAGREDVEVKFETCDAQRYDGVELIGKPIVVGLSADAAGTKSTPPELADRPTEIELVAAWSTAQWLAYLAALDDEDPLVNDGYRADDRFRSVFQRFRLSRQVFPPGESLMDWPPRGWPRVRDDGTLEAHGLGDPAAVVPAQTTERHTLDWVPLRDGYRYDTNPPTYEGDGDTIPEFLPPLALIYALGFGETPIGWTTLDKLNSIGYRGGTVGPLRGEWGVRIECTPNHALAANHWIVPPYAEPAASAFDPDVEGLDYSDLVVTLAVAGDHCVRRVAMLPDNEQAGTGQLMRIYVPEAELHVLLPHTVLGADAGGELLYSPDDELMVLRDDRPLLDSLLPGAIGRLLRSRQRASINYAWIWPATQCLGQLFEAATIGDQRQIVNAVITSVSYNFSRGQMTLRTGQAVE